MTVEEAPRSSIALPPPPAARRPDWREPRGAVAEQAARDGAAGAPRPAPSSWPRVFPGL
jgi:hypothetical protein